MESLNVIALISGGKDSFYSLLHCLANGHKVVALGNLYPPIIRAAAEEGGKQEQEQDLNSFMYQTVGHTIIPLYAQALEIPLFRQEIRGRAVVKGLSYEAVASSEGDGEDETEDLLPLLERIMSEFPKANALCTGAILSTYQRTRIESVALGLGLVPLSYLWQYPVLPPHSQISLLEDMEKVGLQARIVKVASGGLDDEFLWEDVVGAKGRGRVERAMRRFGQEGDGGVIGEGGEFETLVLDGPSRLFKGRIVVDETDRRVVREGGGAAWLSIEEGRVEMKDGSAVVDNECRIPDLLDVRFLALLKTLEIHASMDSSSSEIQLNSSSLQLGKSNSDVLNWTFGGNATTRSSTIVDEATSIISSIHQCLKERSFESTHIVSTVIILRSMDDFATINKIYSTLFPHPNPPSRVTISAGSLLPPSQNLLIHLTLSPSSAATRKALHVQSRSYWAPANIGPYSQAITYPLPSTDPDRETTSVVKVAGQIPLIPASMSLPISSPEEKENGFNFQTVLSLQHLWRIGTEMGVRWWLGAVAFIPSSSISFPSELKSKTISKAWRSIHQPPLEDDDDDDTRDLWEERYRQGSSAIRQEGEKRDLPDWGLDIEGTPLVFTAEVEELPRGSAVEWCTLGGISGGVQSILMRKCEGDGWRFSQTIVNERNVYTILSIFYDTDIETIIQRLVEAAQFMGVSRSEMVALGSATYLDIEIDGIWTEGKEWKGKVPCRSIWDENGQRIGGIWVLEGIS